MKVIVCNMKSKSFGIPVSIVISIEKLTEVIPIPKAASYIRSSTR